VGEASKGAKKQKEKKKKGREGHASSRPIYGKRYWEWCSPPGGKPEGGGGGGCGGWWGGWESAIDWRKIRNAKGDFRLEKSPERPTCEVKEGGKKTTKRR